MNLGTRAARLLSLPDIGWGIPRIASEYTPGIAPARARTGDACGIPRVIHTVFGLWDARGMSWRHRWILGGWKRRHSAPDWQIVCWNKQTAEAFIRRESPEHWDLYQSLPRNIQRADLLRYLLLYRLGGFYVDLDVRCAIGIDRVRRVHASTGVLTCVETTLTPQRARRIGHEEPIRNGRAEHTQRIANFFLGSGAGHPLLVNKLFKLFSICFFANNNLYNFILVLAGIKSLMVGILIVDAIIHLIWIIDWSML